MDGRGLLGAMQYIDCFDKIYRLVQVIKKVLRGKNVWKLINRRQFKKKTTGLNLAVRSILQNSVDNFML